MHILAVSDIHGNVESVRQVRARERHGFDAVIVPGDIGGPEKAEEVFAILSSFGCPVLYVYGNADYELAYDAAFGGTCHHMHLRSMAIGGVTFAGMSGCAANWGRNPIAEAQRTRIDDKYRHIIAAYAEAERTVTEAQGEIEWAHQARVKKISVMAKDRRRKEFRDKVSRLENRRDRLLEKATQAKEKIAASAEYAAYMDERWRAGAEIAALNRQALIDAIRATGAPPERTVVITHERLYRMHEDVPGVLLYLAGHKHRFANTVHRGSRFVTVGAIHQPVSVVPEAAEDEGWHNVHNINDGNYARIELRDGEVNATCVPFNPSFAGWRRLRDRYIGDSVPWVRT